MTDHSKRGFSLRSIVSRYIERRREIRAVRQLLELPDSILRDIGINRWDVNVALSSRSACRPSQSLALAASENRMMQAANDRRSVINEVRQLSLAA